MSLIKMFFISNLPSMGQIRDTKLLRKISVVIKQLREEKNISQEEFYNDTNIHIGRIETSRANLTISTLAALCKYFKIKMSDFLKKVEEL